MLCKNKNKKFRVCCTTLGETFVKTNTFIVLRIKYSQKIIVSCGKDNPIISEAFNIVTEVSGNVVGRFPIISM